MEHSQMNASHDLGHGLSLSSLSNSHNYPCKLQNMPELRRDLMIPI